MLKNSISLTTDMNVFGTSQASETNKFVINLEKTIKSFTSKLDKIEYLENHKSLQVQEEQVEVIQSTCVQIAEHMTRGEVSLQLIKESTEGLKNKIPAILSQLNTIETYYKDKP
jgi:archaellum component FlaC